MEEGTRRRCWVLATGLALALVPTRLVERVPARAPAPRADLPESDPMQLVLAPPDLMGDALRLDVTPGFERPEAAPEPATFRAPLEEPVLAEARVAQLAPEPHTWLLLALSLASAAGASRGTRRCPRWHRAR